MDFETHDYDVLVVGAGGAGLRAAIEASAGGVKVALLCKSLLGKAHTVMAEGGIAAALANVDDRDSWKVHFADTMRGGQYVNNWRMAELHAKEAPDRVRELEAWGAVFDRTPDGRILQRNFGGHRYPRLAHVGDRTGLEMIRTLQDHGVHRGIDVHMEFTVVTILRTVAAPRVSWATSASAGGSRCFAPARSCSPPAASAAPTRLRATAGNTPVTAIRWRIARARN
jgi:succinate dehydrogenase / fumarate reductase flavoprotein subunit